MGNSKNKSIENVLCEPVAHCVDRYLRKGQTLALGFSGGVDSVVLLDALRQITVQRGIELSALHVNHALSPNADAWEARCRQLCAEWQVPFTAVAVAVECGSADGLEAAARRARHAEFRRTGSDWIALAHHQGDQAETVLFNLVRGTGLRGAAAMTETNGRLLRPLLGVSRAAILAYAKVRGLPWIEDESNADLDLSRNYLRHEIMPRLLNRFPGGEVNLAAAARRFGEAVSLLDELAISDLGDRAPTFPIAVSTFLSLSEPRARNLLRFLLHCHSFRIPSAERLHEALRQLLHAAPDRHPQTDLGDCILAREKRQIIAVARRNLGS